MIFNFNDYDLLFNEFKKPMDQLSESKHPETGEISYPIKIKDYALSGDALAKNYSKRKSCKIPHSHDALTLSKISENKYRLNLIEFKFISIKKLTPKETIKQMKNKFEGIKKILMHFNIWYSIYYAFYVFDINPKPKDHIKIDILIKKIEKAEKKNSKVNFKILKIKTFEKKIKDFKNYK